MFPTLVFYDIDWNVIKVILGGQKWSMVPSADAPGEDQPHRRQK